MGPNMAAGRKPEECSLLIFSVWMGVVFTALGIGWGLAIQSGVILFDGIYSGFSIIRPKATFVVRGIRINPIPKF
jgi:predicted Co/Zn/Cd cation transporter (cation efflux family)